jgi:hypothetical protein
MKNKPYHKSDIERALRFRDAKQLTMQFSIVDEMYPEGDFTFIEFGCADGKLLSEWLTRYPNASFIGVDLDIENKYVSSWESIVRDHPNIKAIIKGNMTDTDFLNSILEENFNSNTVDIIHSHAALMYLSDSDSAKFFEDASSYAKIIISRDVNMTNLRLGINTKTEIEGQLIEKCYQDIDTHWKNSLGRYIRPPTIYETRNSTFNFTQISDFEIYTQETSPTLEERMESLKISVPNLLKGVDEQGEEYLAEGYSEKTLSEVEVAMSNFGKYGDYYISHWYITILKNSKVFATSA